MIIFGPMLEHTVIYMVTKTRIKTMENDQVIACLRKLEKRSIFPPILFYSKQEALSAQGLLIGRCMPNIGYKEAN